MFVIPIFLNSGPSETQWGRPIDQIVNCRFSALLFIVIDRLPFGWWSRSMFVFAVLILDNHHRSRLYTRWDTIKIIVCLLCKIVDLKCNRYTTQLQQHGVYEYISYILCIRCSFRLPPYVQRTQSSLCGFYRPSTSAHALGMRKDAGLGCSWLKGGWPNPEGGKGINQDWNNARITAKSKGWLLDMDIFNYNR